MKLTTDQRSLPRRLALLGFSSYAEYLDSEHWKSVRARYRASKVPDYCARCGGPGENLHHKTYERLGREWLRDLVLLCRPHHEAVHRHQREQMENGTYRGLAAATRDVVNGPRKPRRPKKKPADSKASFLAWYRRRAFS
jgi:hypothetical protein